MTPIGSIIPIVWQAVGLGFFLPHPYSPFSRNNIPIEKSWARALDLVASGAQISLHLGGIAQNNSSDGEVTQNLLFIFGFSRCLVISAFDQEQIRSGR